MFYPTYLQGVTVMQRIPEQRLGITAPLVINPFQLEAAPALDAVLNSIVRLGEVCDQIEPAAQDHVRTNSTKLPYQVSIL